MTRTTLLAALLALLIAAPAWAADDGWHPNSIDCTGATDATPALLPGKQASWCPISSTTQIARVANVADCNWNADTSGSGAGSVTLTATKCSGSTTAANDCKNLFVNGDGVSTITSGDVTGIFNLDSGLWLITASGTAANGRLLCTGR